MVGLTFVAIIVVGGTVLGALIVFVAVLLAARYRLQTTSRAEVTAASLTSQPASQPPDVEVNGLFKTLDRALGIAIEADQEARDIISENPDETKDIAIECAPTPSTSMQSRSTKDRVEKRQRTVALLVLSLLGLASTSALGALALERPESMMIVSLAEAHESRCSAGQNALSGMCFEVAAPSRWIGVSRGEFFMGSRATDPGREDDEIRHSVRLTHAFFIQATEVTQAQFHRVMGYNPSRYFGCGLDCPVEQVSWHEAAAYTNALSAMEGLEECYVCRGARELVECYRLESPYICEGYRLPTEAEWEYAARGGTSLEPRNEKVLNDVAWHLDNSRVHYVDSFPIAGGSGPRSVGLRQANRLGLNDTLGNVAEWCHDWYSTYGLYGNVDPYGAGAGEGRVIRGGSWWDPSSRVRIPLRGSSSPNSRSDTNGFRVVRSL